MGYLMGHNSQMRWAVFLLFFFSSLAWAAPTDSNSPSERYPGAPQDPFIYIVVILVLVGAFVALAVIRAAVSGSQWSLAEALSEEVEVTDMVQEKPGGAAIAKKDDKGNPVKITRLCASSSRLIALMGMMVILLMFLGFGAFALFSFGKTGELPTSITRVVHFLLAGLTLFAPYAVNKFASIFETISPKPGG